MSNFNFEDYYNVSVHPMDKNGKNTDGYCRELYLHKKYYPILAGVLDKLHESEINDNEVIEVEITFSRKTKIKSSELD